MTRQPWLDVARGAAVVSMLIAHLAPAGGIFNVTEYLTAPLFGAIIGVAAVYAWRAWTSGAARFIAAYAARGALLFGAGLLAQPIYAQIVVVLQWLGALTVLVAPLVVLLHRRPWIALAAAGALVGVAYPWMVAARGNPAGPVTGFIIAGGPYRLVPLLAAALLGVALAGWLADAAVPRTQFLLASGLGVVVAGGAVLVGKLTSLGADPYSGTWPEMIACLGLVLWALAGSRWLGAVLGEPAWLAPIVATGRLAMTAYVLQLVVLRLLVDLVLQGGRDDHWWVLGVTTVIVIGACWAWWRWLGMGPLERILRLPVRWARGA